MDREELKVSSHGGSGVLEASPSTSIVPEVIGNDEMTANLNSPPHASYTRRYQKRPYTLIRPVSSVEPRQNCLQEHSGAYMRGNAPAAQPIPGQQR